MLVVLLFIFGLGFIICASVVQTGQGLRTHQLCYASALICLFFYTGNNLTMFCSTPPPPCKDTFDLLLLVDTSSSSNAPASSVPLLCHGSKTASGCRAC